MTKEHSHAQVLRWIADGKTVLYCGVDYSNSAILSAINDFRPVENFTLAPRRIKVGSREINAPLREAPADGTKYWSIGEDGDVFRAEWSGHPSDEDRVKYGNVWTTEADATAARDAVRDLMMGGK